MIRDRAALLTHADAAQYAHVEEHVVQAQTLLAVLGDVIDAEADEPLEGNRVRALHLACVRSMEDLASLVEAYYAPRRMAPE